MVATAGRGWVLAPCLVELERETNRLFPRRSTASDGSIGDTAHAARTSDHNPDNGFVRALDLTDDDAAGCDISLLFAHLVATKDDRVKYLIHKHTIWKAYANRGLAPWTPQPYTGSNPHTRHGHISIRDGAERILGPWWPQSQLKPEPPTPQPTPQLVEGKPMDYYAVSNGRHYGIRGDGIVKLSDADAWIIGVALKDAGAPGFLRLPLETWNHISAGLPVVAG